MSSTSSPYKSRFLDPVDKSSSGVLEVASLPVKPQWADLASYRGGAPFGGVSMLVLPAKACVSLLSLFLRARRRVADEEKWTGEQARLHPWRPISQPPESSLPRLCLPRPPRLLLHPPPHLLLLFFFFLRRPLLPPLARPPRPPSPSNLASGGNLWGADASCSEGEARLLRGV